MPSHFSVWVEPPDEAGDEILRIVSGRRSITLKGHSFRDFHRHVRPLLDGRHTMEEICEQTSDIFDADDLDEALRVLASHGIVVEGVESLADSPAGYDEPTIQRLTPQLNYLHETAVGGSQLQQRIAATQIAVIGMGGAGAATAMGLAAAGVGKMAVVDAESLVAADVYFSPFLGLDEIGSNRADLVAAKIKSAAPQVEVTSVSHQLDSDDAVREVVSGSNLIVCCLDAGMLNVAYKLNRVCLQNRIPWIASSLEGPEVVVGPAFHPGHGPCFMCYRMRGVACARNPQSALAFEKHLDRQKADAGDQRDNLVFGAGIVANLLGVEIVNFISGAAEPALRGRLMTVNLQTLETCKHSVLVKPDCPACRGRTGG